MLEPFVDLALSDQDRKAIHDFALIARERLTKEARELLEGIYGLHDDGHFEPLENLPSLKDPEIRAIYDRLRLFLEDEVEAGLKRKEAVDKLVKEVAFTHINRLVAFKMMEVRKLIREAVSRGPDSNGFKYYLADHSKDETLWRSGEADLAYQHFLLWQADQISQELGVLFDIGDLSSALFPRHQAMQDVLAMLNHPDLAKTWTADDTIGWLYQFFNEEEKAAVFDRLFKQKKKIRRQDIPAATQLFTPRWIVRFLVENTLGRMWVQMHPDTQLKSRLRYLVPLSGEIPREHFKLVKEITLLDPALGTMQFGLVSFDLFHAMYQEELRRSGESGWPEEPSTKSESEIPESILRHNLFGIDIDLRTVQLSALTLYLKAKSINPDAHINDHNLACADVLPLNGSRLGSFLNKLQFSRPIYERLIRKIWERLEDINQLGSLLRLELEIGELIKGERERFEREGRQLDLFRDVQAEFEIEAAQGEYWEILSANVIQALDYFVKTQAEHGHDERFFAGEAAKSFRVLNLMLRRYDVVVTNPPYMSRRNMNKTLADFLVDQYPYSKGDLYAAFIERCADLVDDYGRVGMITQQSFMFISSYEKLRKQLLSEFAIETMAHTGPKAFPEISGEKVNTTIFVLRCESNVERREKSVGTYFRLVHEPDAKSKQRAFEKAVKALQKQKAA